MNKKEFLEKYNGKAVHCKTKRLSDEFLELCDKYDFKQLWGLESSKICLWDEYEEDTCYRIDNNKFNHCGIDFYKRGKYEIIEFQSLKSKVKTKSNLFNEQIKLLTEIKNKLRDFNEIDGEKIALNSTIADIEEIIEECENEKKYAVKCPLCDCEMEYNGYNNTHIWSCEKCPAVLFEFYDNSNIKDIKEFLVKGDK